MLADLPIAGNKFGSGSSGLSNDESIKRIPRPALDAGGLDDIVEGGWRDGNAEFARQDSEPILGTGVQAPDLLQELHFQQDYGRNR